MTTPILPDTGNSIRRRLLAFLIVPAIGILLAGTLVDYVARQHPVRDAYDQVLADSAVAIATNVRTDANGHAAISLPTEAVSILRTDAIDAIYFRVNGPDGKFLAGDADLPGVSESTTSNPAFENASYRGQPVRMVSYHSPTSAGSVTTVVAETLNKRRKVRARLLLTSLITDLVELAAILGIVWIGVRQALKPLRALQQQIAARKARDLEPLDTAQAPIEVRSVVQELNRLFATISDSSRTQRQFLENSAHQLRTPLAGLQAQIELLMGEELGAGPRERLGFALAATRRLGHTTRQLLALARSEQTIHYEKDFVSVDLMPLAEACVSDQLSNAIAARLDLGADLQPVTVRGVNWLISEALNNVVDNAIKYTPAGGSITVRCGQVGTVAFVEVTDTGVGIPPGERDRVTQRFVRGQFTRGEGNGLGLAIVADIAKVLAARLSIDAGAQGRGTSVRLEFRALGPADATRVNAPQPVALA